VAKERDGAKPSSDRHETRRDVVAIAGDVLGTRGGGNGHDRTRRRRRFQCGDRVTQALCRHRGVDALLEGCLGTCDTRGGQGGRAIRRDSDRVVHLNFGRGPSLQPTMRVGGHTRNRDH